MKANVREAKEAAYMKVNSDINSVCCGKFYISNKKEWEQCKHCDVCQRYERYKNKKEGDAEVKFLYVNSFRNCENYKTRLATNADKVKLAIYTVLYVNDIAFNLILDCKKHVEKKDRKAWDKYKSLFDMAKKYQRDILNIIGDTIDYYADFCSNMDEKIMPIIDELTEAIERCIKSEGNVNYKNLAALTVASTAIDASCHVNDRIITTFIRMNIENIVFLQHYRLTDMQRLMCVLLDRCSRHANITNLNNDDDVKRIFRQFIIEIVKPENISDAMNRATNNFNK